MPAVIDIALDLAMTLGEKVTFTESFNDLHRFTLADGILITVTDGSFFSENPATGEDWTEATTVDELGTDIAVLRTKVGA